MKDRTFSQKKNLSGLMVLLLFGVFAVCILSVLISGTHVYDRLAARDKAAYDGRTAAQYLSTRIRQAQSPDAVSIRSEGGTTVVCISETYEAESFETWLYCRDGWLCELFLFSDAEVDPENSEKLLPAESLSGSLENGLLTLRITDDGGEQTVRILLRGGEVHP